ncbi:hypothetical protein [Spirosoma sp. KNUC1025]|uniref:hypothetical protein n=1 Tax=Spirosoma sp. KNUC1025 TaxID=2894082 RepID=UPI0038671261|nr:hypothetical protein LN737_17725 [Spirosoma sp. KNUC1025]
MNQYTLLFFSLLLLASTTQAQSVVALNTVNPSAESPMARIAPRATKATEAPFYLKIYGFYSLLTPGSEINYSATQSQTTAPTIYKPINARLGAGPRAGIGIGMIVSDFINVGIDADMLFGSAVKIDYDLFVGSGNTFSRYVISTNTTLKVLSITPNITFKALSRPAYYIYNRLGLVGGLVMEYKITSSSTETPTRGAVTTTTGTTDYTKNSLALGYQAALGIQFRLSQAVRGFAEVVAYNQSFKPREVQFTSTSVRSGASTVQSSSTVFKNEGDYNKTNPTEQPSFNVSINSVGVGAGLMFRF